MAAVRRGDAEATAALYTLSQPHLRRIAAADLRRCGVTATADRVSDIASDGFVYLLEHAAAWDPERGAPPWQWARMKLRAIAWVHAGVGCSPIDDAPEIAEPATQVRSSDDPHPVEVFANLCRSRPVLALLDEALQQVSARDRAVWLSVLSASAEGNPASAQSVAEEFGLSHAAVRKICQRLRERVRRAIADDARLAPLAEMTCLSGAA